MKVAGGWLGAVLCAAVLGPSAAAQSINDPAHPNGPPALNAPPLPDARTFVLPPVTPLPPDSRTASPALRVRVSQIEVRGNTALPAEDLASMAARYENRDIDAQDLHDLCRKITLAYVQKGYINSGAVLPDQEIRDGHVVIEVIEGRLNQIVITGTDWLDDDYVRDRITLGAEAPLNVNALQERLILLQQGKLVERLNAQLLPGTRPGESALQVAVTEASPYSLDISVSNDRPPTVGAYDGTVHFASRDLSGRGDQLDLSYDLVGTGIDGNYALSYSLPVTKWDTSINLAYSHSSALVTTAEFNSLDISSRSSIAGIGVSQPFWQTVSGGPTVGVRLEHRQSQSLLAGQPFAFNGGNAEGKNSDNVLRLTQDWIDRQPDQVIALRSTVSLGITNAVPTLSYGDPSKRFAVWLGQAQYSRRLDDQGDQLVARVDYQWTRDVLYPIERFAVGGVATVRGYRENEMVRDYGTVASLELRLPAFTESLGDGTLALAPFVDVGHANDNKLAASPPGTLASAGLGLLLNPLERLQARLNVGRRLVHVSDSGGHDLQDYGVEFVVAYHVF